MRRFTREDILTIPNILSFFRIILIPIIVILYYKYHMYGTTAFVIILSGITDVADGYIARRFNMISDFGKILDPIADKLTQASLVLCLFTRFPHMLIIFILMAIKEAIMSVTGVWSIRNSGKIRGAAWHGKINTVLIYAVMFLHIVWYNIPSKVSDILLVMVACFMTFSLVLYVLSNIQMVRKYRDKVE